MSNMEITIEDRKFSSREGCIGIAYPDKLLVKIDPRLGRDKYIEILIHELLHVVQPYLDENAVTEYGEIIGKHVVRTIEQKGWFA